MNITRRGLFAGVAATLAAPAIAKAELLMPVRRLIVPRSPWIPCDGRRLDRRDYAALYATIGENYNLPFEAFTNDMFRVPTGDAGAPSLLQAPMRMMICAEQVPNGPPVGSLWMMTGEP